MSVIILTIITLLICFAFGYTGYAEFYDSYILNILFEYFFVLAWAITLVFYLPLFLICLIRKKKNHSIENLKKFFKAVNWFVIITTLAFGLWQMFGVGAYQQEGLLPLLPFLIIPVLFYWVNRLKI